VTERTSAEDLGDHVDGPDADDRAPRSARIFVAILFVLVLVPGVVGFDAWPLTGWRLFSVSRDADQTRWVIRATDGSGDARTVSLEELPLRYRHAEWPMSQLPGASDGRRREVCEALLSAVRRIEPSTVELTIARDRARLVEQDDGWETEHDYEAVETCTGGVGPTAGSPG
jgi:hypothetical protein